MSEERWLTDATDAERRALRKALDEVAPFAPSDVRRHRVWVELARARTRHRLTRRAFAAGAVLASALTAGAFLVADHWLRRHRALDAGGRVVASETSAEPARAQPPAPAAPRPVAPTATTTTTRTPPAPSTDDVEMLAPGGSVKTGAGERSARRLTSGVRVEVQPASALALDTAGRADLQNGEARFDVPAQAAGRPFVVRIASYYVMVAGARFSARVDAGGVQVSVESGAVEIWGVRRLARVTAGESWRRAARAARTRTTAARATAPRTAAPRLEDSPASADPEATSDAAELAAAREAGASDPARAIAQLRAEADLSIFDALAERGQAERALDEGRAFLRRHPHSERRGEVARVAADLARQRGQCRLAAELYAQVADTRVSRDDADDAAFGRASCLGQLGDEAAREALADYLASYPRGRHAAEARKLMARP